MSNDSGRHLVKKYSLSPIAAAAVWMSGALLSFMAMAVGGRELSAELGTFHILFWRSVVGFAVLAVLVSHTGWAQLRTPVPGLHLFRNTAHFVGQFGWFYGLANIPLAAVFALEFTTPIWTALLAWVFLGEKPNKTRFASVALGFIGILVILRPGVAIIDLAALAVLAAAIGYAVSHTVTKRLSRDDTPLAILFFMTVIQLPLGLLPALGDWHWPSVEAAPWLIVVGVSALTAHYCIVRALARADAMVVVPLDFLRLPLIAVVGLVFYSEGLDPWLMVGAALILFGTLANIRRERGSGKPQETINSETDPRRRFPVYSESGQKNLSD